MTDHERALEKLNYELDHFAEELGLDEEALPEAFTFDLGFRLGSRLRELLPVEQEVYDALVLDALAGFAETFPKYPDDETKQLQTFLFAPPLSFYLTGRGLSTSELSAVAGVRPARLYRMLRKGLSLVYKPANPKIRSGTNREYSGVDHRKTRYTLDHQGLLKKDWPEPMCSFQPFLAGLIEGARRSLEDPWVWSQVESGVRVALAKALEDPVVEEIFDAVLHAAQRLVQSLRDNQLLLTNLERERGQRFEDMLVVLAEHRADLLARMKEAAGRLRSETPPALQAGAPA